MKKLAPAPLRIYFVCPLFSPSFDPGTGTQPYDGLIYALGLQNDGKIVIGGYFQTYDGISRKGIARINPDGSLDTSFDPGTGVGSQRVYCLDIQQDNKIVIGGSFYYYNDLVYKRIAQINLDGSPDPTFDPGEGVGDYYPTVDTMEIQSDGRILIGGDFTHYDTVGRNDIARVYCQPSVVPTLSPWGALLLLVLLSGLWISSSTNKSTKKPEAR